MAMATSTIKLMAQCIFCRIIKGEIPSYKLLETDSAFSFLDIGPLSQGHALIVPKYHAEKMHELPDAYLTDVLPIAKKIALANGCTNYNILQNNGRLAHQEVPHVHFHVIPKSEEDGLKIGWAPMQVDDDGFKATYAKITSHLAAISHSEGTASSSAAVSTESSEPA